MGRNRVSFISCVLVAIASKQLIDMGCFSSVLILGHVYPESLRSISYLDL